MGDLTAHFSRAEFRCHHCKATGSSPQLLEILERLRAIRKTPLTIVSGFRCVVHNASVGGALDSRHVYSDAADIPIGYATLAQAQAAGAIGIGTKDQWAVHVDWRPGRQVIWRYS